MIERQEFRHLVDRFLPAVSHDLRTPLAVIAGYAELLERRPDDERLRREAPTRIREAVEQLAAALDAILMTSVLDAGEVIPEPGPVDLGIVITGAIRDAKGAGRSHVLIAQSLEPEWPSVHGDQDLVAQVVRSLISNACSYSSPGSRVTIRAWREGDRGIVSVQDEGPRIGEDELERVLERSFRGKAAAGGGASGSGLGLYVARRLIEVQGGELWAARGPGRGSSFTFALPLALP
ncbi:MAG: hypothetical protein C4289_11805 [Chloroflexota bacterium]